MKKSFAMCILLLLMALPAHSATLSWSAVTTYADGSIIPIDKTVTYTTYTGPSASDLSTVQGTTTATSAAVPDPSPGQTMYYTVDAMVDGVRSEKAAPVSKTVPFKNPSPPTNLTIQ